MEFTTCPNGSRSNTGTLERAQSLEISDSIAQATAGRATPKKRKAAINDPMDATDFKEPRLSDAAASDMDPIQHSRLKSAYEWGNLEDAIYDGRKENGNVSDTESIGNETSMSKLSSSSMDMMTEVLAAADKFEKETRNLGINDNDELVENNVVIKKEVKHEAFVINWDSPEHEPKMKPLRARVSDHIKEIDDTKKFIEIESQNGFHEEKKTNGINHSPEPTTGNHLTATSETITISPVHYELQNEDTEVESIRLDKSDADQIKIINCGSNISDDVKVSRYPFGSLERPKSEVFKKLIAEQFSTDENQKLPNGVSSTKIVPDHEPISIEATKTTSIEGGPISLTLGSHIDIESDLTESSQISPVFSSDGQGVNSISISSTESSIRPEPRKDMLPGMLAVDNVVTISTDGSQPSSIIMIEDETLNFTLQTVNDEVTAPIPLPKPTVSNIPQPTATRIGKDEVVIIESLSSKKVHGEKPLARSNGDISPPMKNFVTEIRLQNSRKEAKQTGTDVEEHTSESSKQITNSLLDTNANPTVVHGNHNNNEEKSVIVEEEYIPRNTEIKFTTSTYESPQRPFEKRHSHIDQIRSNFERNHNSEIPVPIRKSAPPTTPPTPTSNVRTSPSKIPVFHSQKSSDNLLKNNGNVNKVSVSVTSIKNSSRNPSGK